MTASAARDITTDLANVVSKYIGETERNVEAVFADAERRQCQGPT
jgi:SpoVK/Ycf46/Vps4 family AAA+-type ATPase